MKKSIENFDKLGRQHGVQIDYYSNGNILCIGNFNHGKLNGYRGSFNPYNLIHFKQYLDMNKCIYGEYHLINQIQINI